MALVVSSKPSKVEGNYPIILPPVKGSKCSRGSAFPHPGAGLDAAQEEHRKTNKVVDPPETKEGDCPGVGIADCSWEQPLGTVPAPSWGTELLCTAVGVVGGLCPCPGHTLAVHGHRCLTPGCAGQQSLTGGATLIRISGKSVECPRSPVALPCLAVPSARQEPARTRAQPCRSWPWASFALRVEHKRRNCWPGPVPSKLGAGYGIPWAAPTPSPRLLYPSLRGH